MIKNILKAYIGAFFSHTIPTTYKEGKELEKDFQRVFCYRTYSYDSGRTQLAFHRNFRFQLCNVDFLWYDVVGKIVVYLGGRCRRVYDCLALRFSLPNGRKRHNLA